MKEHIKKNVSVKVSIMFIASCLCQFLILHANIEKQVSTPDLCMLLRGTTAIFLSSNHQRHQSSSVIQLE